MNLIRPYNIFAFYLYFFIERIKTYNFYYLGIQNCILRCKRDCIIKFFRHKRFRRIRISKIRNYLNLSIDAANTTTVVHDKTKPRFVWAIV